MDVSRPVRSSTMSRPPARNTAPDRPAPSQERDARDRHLPRPVEHGDREVDLGFGPRDDERQATRLLPAGQHELGAAVDYGATHLWVRRDAVRHGGRWRAGLLPYGRYVRGLLGEGEPASLRLPAVCRTFARGAVEVYDIACVSSSAAPH